MKTQLEKPQNVMVSIAFDPTKSRDLMEVGLLPKVLRTKAQQAQLNELYLTQASVITPSLDVNRLNRTDAAGNKQVDGGYLIFSALGQKNVTPRKLVADLTKLGYCLVVVEIFEQEGKDKRKLRLTWSLKIGATVTLEKRQAQVVRKYFDLSYFKLFGFRNLKAVSLEGNQSPIQGSIVTLNFSGVNAPADREVRMCDDCGHFQCLPIETTTKAPADRHPIGGTTTEVVDKAFSVGIGTQCPSRPSPAGGH